MEQKKIYEGKAKILYRTEDPETLVLQYKDDITAGNGAKKEKLSGKGALNCAISNILFQVLQENGIPTHFVKALDPLNILVKQVEIIPLEVIIRNRAAGSFSRKYGVQEGTALPVPVIEFCYKNDALGDPLINRSQIMALDLADREDLEKISDQAFRINELLKSFFEKNGLRLIDFKLEFGRSNGEILLADEISPDTCRIWRLETDEKLDKDLFRHDSGDIIQAYREVLRRIENE